MNSNHIALDHPLMRSLRLAALAVAASLLGGCGPTRSVEIPPTYPVQGRVTFADGRPLTRGAVQFQSLDNREISTGGEIGPDGSFTLKAFVVGAAQPGAMAGSYRVTILPSHPELVLPPTILPDPVTVAAEGNEFHFIVDDPPADTIRMEPPAP